MKNKCIHIGVRIFDNGKVFCKEQTMLDNILSGKIHCTNVDYDVHYNGPHGWPWGEREEHGLEALREDIKDIPEADPWSWSYKHVNIWVTL